MEQRLLTAIGRFTQTSREELAAASAQVHVGEWRIEAHEREEVRVREAQASQQGRAATSRPIKAFRIPAQGATQQEQADILSALISLQI